MKRGLIIVVLLLLAVFLAAEDFAVRKAWKLDMHRQSLECSDGSIIVIYTDTDAGNADIYAQKLSPTGEIIWAQPKVIASDAGEPYIYKCIKTNDGSFVILYISEGEEPESRYLLQKFDANGQLLWGEEGCELQSGTRFLLKYDLVPNQSGGVYLIYQPFHDNNVYCYNIDTYGNILNQAPGQILLDNERSFWSCEAFEDGEGGFILAINNNYYYPSSYHDITLYRFTEALEPIGSAPLLPPTAFPTTDYRILPDKDGKFILWKTQQNQLYLQRMDKNGNLDFPQAITLSFDFELNGYYVSARDQALALADGGVAFCLFHRDIVDFNLHHTQARIIRLNSEFQHLWDENGVLAAEQLSFYDNDWARFQGTDAGGFWLSWNEKPSYDAESFLKIQRIDANGNLNWGVTGNTLCSGNLNYENTFLQANTDGALCVFHDLNNGFTALKREYISNTSSQSFNGGEAFISHLGGTAFSTDVAAMDTGYFVHWVDTRSGRDQIYYQIYDLNMNALCEPNGRSLGATDYESITIQKSPLMQDASLPLLITIRESWGAGYSLYLQQVLPTGELLFPKPGLLLASSAFYSQALISNDGNDIYVAWLTGDVMGQKITNGIIQWEEGGKILVANEPDFPIYDLHHFRDGYIILKYASPGAEGHRLFKINAAGEMDAAWPESGVELFEPYLSQADPWYVFKYAVHSGEDIIVYAYQSSGHTFVMQKVYADAAKKWDDPGLCLPYGWLNYIKKDAGDFWLLFESGDSPNDIYLYKMDAEGEMLISGTIILENGLRIYSDLELIKYDNGAIYFVWMATPNTDTWLRNIYCRKIDQDGEIAGAVEVFCNAWLDRYDLNAARVGNNALVVWTDARHGVLDSENYLFSSYARKLDAFPTSIEDEYLPVPKITQLKQNYPNPFNPETTISFDLASAGEVSLDIFNIKGQLVKRLAQDQKLPAGSHSFVWDGKDDSGKNLSSGIYLYRLQNGKYSHSKKMIMMK